MAALVGARVIVVMVICHVAMVSCKKPGGKPPKGKKTTPSPSPATPPPSSSGGTWMDSGCGQKSACSKIVGGSNAGDSEYPWQVALVRRYKGGYYIFCGGTIISPNYILTAAHCMGGKFQVKLGMTSQGDRGVIISVSRTTKHPQYNSNTLDYDSALVRLSSPIPSGDCTMVPVCAPDTDGDYEGSMATITGWGSLGSGQSSSPNVLQEVTVPIWSNADCDSAYDYPITARMVCAGLTGGGKDSCQGDSGGPMVVSGDSGWQLVGIVSWGIGCALPNYPGVYTRVSTVVDWINGIIM